MIRFAHIADCHVGSWREIQMRQINLSYFEKVIDSIINEHNISKISFIIISGDLFNTAMPSIDALKVVTEKLNLLKNNNINIYGVAGSHDYSSAGKTFLEVLEKAGLFTNLMKGFVDENNKLNLDFTKDPSGIKLTGIIGKKSMLDKKLYQTLNYENLEQETGDKIFVFHSAIDEYKPEDLASIDGMSLKLLPKGFEYYAGGHIHYRFEKQLFEGKLAFPGPTCPNNFKEWVDLEGGSYILGKIENSKVDIEFKYIQDIKIKPIEICVDNLDVFNAKEKIMQDLFNSKDNNLDDIENINLDLENKLILLKIYGKLSSGSISDLHLEDLNKLILKNNAYWILRNTSKLNSTLFEEDAQDVEDLNKIESEIIDNNIKDSNLKNLKKQSFDYVKQKELIFKLMNSLSIEKTEGETNLDFFEKIDKEVETILENDFS